MNRRQFFGKGLALAAGAQIVGGAAETAVGAPSNSMAGSPLAGNGMIAVMAELLFKEDDSSLAAQALAELAMATRLEPGCIRYIVSQDLREPGRFHLSELWSDLESLADHFDMPHMARFSSTARGLGYSAPYLKQMAIASLSDFKPSELRPSPRPKAGSGRP